MSRGTQGHTMATSLWEPETGRVWGTQVVSFSAHSHFLIFAPFFSPICPSRLSLLWYTETSHVLTPQRRQPQLPNSCFLSSCTQHSLHEHLSISVPIFWEGDWGRRRGATWSNLLCAGCPALPHVTVPGQVSEKGRAQWAEQTPLKVSGTRTLTGLIPGPCSLCTHPP